MVLKWLRAFANQKQKVQFFYGSDIFVFIFEQSSYLFSLKNSRPSRDLDPGPPWYKADMLPIELSWLGYLITMSGIQMASHSPGLSLRDSFVIFSFNFLFHPFSSFFKLHCQSILHIYFLFRSRRSRPDDVIVLI